jgi:hypothetical protein
MKNSYIIIWCLFISAFSFAQAPVTEYIYLATGNKVKGKIVSADEDKISAILENGARYTAQRNKFVIFFNKFGGYITEKNLALDSDKAQQQIQAFYKSTTGAVSFNDILFKVKPREVIACTIKNELEDAVNYQTLDGKSASVNKDNLFGIIRRNGTHELMQELPTVVENLTDLNAAFDSLRVIKPQAKETRPIPIKSNSTPALTETAPPPKEKKRLTSEQQKIYKAKSVDKMQELASLLNDIVDSRRSRAEKDIAIQKAAGMFIRDAKVEVSAVNNPNIKTNRDVREYLSRLSRLNYSKVKVTYAEINFIEEFEPDDQGNYWGLASYIQTFVTNAFADLTPKRQRIKLQPYQKIVDGASEDKFEILLGNISINVSQ